MKFTTLTIHDLTDTTLAEPVLLGDLPIPLHFTQQEENAHEKSE